MDFAPKNVEELLVYAALLAVAALWRAHAKGRERCEKEVEQLRSEVQKLHLSIHSDANAMAERGEERERLLSIMVQRVTQAMEDQREVIVRSIRMLRRYDPDPSPMPGEEDTPIIRPKSRARDDETSAIFRERS